MVRRETFEKAQPGARDVEGAIAIEQALAAFAPDDGTEAEVAIARLLVW
jgi:hypothetical protein